MPHDNVNGKVNGDLISRKALVKALIAERDKHPPETIDRYSFGVKVPSRFNQAIRGGIRKALREVEMAPSVDAVPVVHGRWIERETEKPLILRCVMCSECGTMYQRRHKAYLNYCPNCGAKMDKEDECDE